MASEDTRPGSTVGPGCGGGVCPSGAGLVDCAGLATGAEAAEVADDVPPLASRSNFSLMSWMKWQRGPYGQKPFEWNVLQKSVLYFGCRVTSFSSARPCAN